MTSPSPSLLTAITVLDTLVRTGMRHILLSPGSRSAPLAYAIGALVDAQVLEAHVRVDERVAAFTALGIAKATGLPVGVVTTSGTAVGECLPAFMEAYHSGVPLVLLSADRPSYMRGSGANQTTDQRALLGQHVRAFAQLENYSAASGDPQSKAWNRALAALTGRNPQNWSEPATTPRGPVHANLALDTPLAPDPREADLLKKWAASLREVAAGFEPGLSPVTGWQEQTWLSSQQLPETGYRTVVLAGDGSGPLAQAFAQKLGLPLLAEPSSNARFSPLAVPAYRRVLAGPLGGQIQRAVVFGHTTLSRPVASLLADSGVQRMIYEPEPAPWHEPGQLGYPASKNLAELAEFAGHGALARADDGSPWCRAWLEAGREQEEQLRLDIERYRSSGQIPEGAAERTPGLSLALRVWEETVADGAVLVLGSSNLVRDTDLIAPGAPVSPLVFSNRGLAGIDGTLATASGISLALGKKVRLLCGDLTFLHDSGALNIGPLERKPQVEVVVFDDRGGGIFLTLEHGQLAQTEQFGHTVHRFFTTPHTADLQKLADCWGDNGIRVQLVRP